MSLHSFPVKEERMQSMCLLTQDVPAYFCIHDLFLMLPSHHRDQDFTNIRICGPLDISLKSLLNLQITCLSFRDHYLSPSQYLDLQELWAPFQYFKHICMLTQCSTVQPGSGQCFSKGDTPTPTPKCPSWAQHWITSESHREAILVPFQCFSSNPD